MAKKIIRIAAISLSALLLALIIFVLVVGLSPDTWGGDAASGDYAQSMKRSDIKSQARVVDIAMLGAHDAFSHNIEVSSPLDVAVSEDSILKNGFVSSVGSGLIVRLTKAQISGAEQLLCSGVRYLDIRLSYMNYQGKDQWVTKHEKVSAPFEEYLSETIMFLDKYQGEFLVLDFQHVYTGESSYSELISYLDTFEVYGKTLTSFLNYDPSAVPLSELTYGDVTNDGSKSGIVILLKKSQASGSIYYDYDNSIRSTWHNKSSEKSMLAGIDGEYQKLTADSQLDRDKFRVNQAQQTGVFSFPELLHSSVVGWSLLNMASNFNQKLVSHENFSDWLSVMPIFMVDFSDSAEGDFNQKANESIIDYNRKLV